MWLQTHAHDLISADGVLDPDAKRLLSMFPNIYARDCERNVEHVLRADPKSSSNLEIRYGIGDETSGIMVELALRKAGVKLADNPFAPKKTSKRKAVSK